MQKQAVQIVYPYPEAEPPIFVAGDFTDPPWDPHELNYEKTSTGESRFSRSFNITDGEWQYKFRLGSNSSEEQWICDNNTETGKIDIC